MIGKTIRILRLTRDLSQGHVARKLGVTPGYLSLVEKDRREPSLGFIRKTASYFNVPIAFLLLDEGEATDFDAKQRGMLKEIRHALLEYLVSRDSQERKAQRRSSVSK
jgi:transcriptional regulator with XRE-family HTH domain